MLRPLIQRSGGRELVLPVAGMKASTLPLTSSTPNSANPRTMSTSTMRDPGAIDYTFKRDLIGDAMLGALCNASEAASDRAL